MKELLNLPIPGESLTGEPRKFPWERPAEINDPKEAIDYHIDRLTEGERLKGVMLVLDSGIMTLEGVTRVLMRSAVSKGMHSIDVGLIAAPVIHEFLKKTAKATGAKYTEELSSEGVSEGDMEELNAVLASLETEDTQTGEVELEAELEDELEEELKEEKVEGSRKGLMSRGDD